MSRGSMKPEIAEVCAPGNHRRNFMILPGTESLGLDLMHSQNTEGIREFMGMPES